MPLTSDVTVNAAKFAPEAVTDTTHKANAYLKSVCDKVPEWYEVGAAKYREMRTNGQTMFPKPTVLPHGSTGEIPSRDSGRSIPVRIIPPGEPGSNTASKGIFMHIHGGGWVLQSHLEVDPWLAHFATAHNLTVLSVGYRLAPEDPYPAGLNDCYDAALFLSDPANVETLLPDAGAPPLRFIGGESAGGHLSFMSAVHLLRAKPDFKFEHGGLILHFGAFDMSANLPSANHLAEGSLILTAPGMKAFGDAFLPGMTAEQKNVPEIAPLYVDLREFKGRLPPALFTIGTADPLIDDTMFMSVKYMMAGGEAIVKVYPGVPHGFVAFPPHLLPEAKQAIEDTDAWIQERLAGL